jgi:glycosyltransferase involved in cell wall biosynthesis
MSIHTPSQKIKVLIIAELANPDWVSVSLVGWCISQAISTLTDAHIVTQVRNREAFLKAGLIEGQDFTAIDSEKVAGPLFWLASKLRGGEGKGWTTLSAAKLPSYFFFENLVWKRFGDEINAGKYHIVHRVTPLSPTLPSWKLSKKCAAANIPFVWGPINGGVPWPKGFDSVRRQEKEWLSYFRNIFKLVPGYRSTRKLASALIIGSKDTFRQMDNRYHTKCFYLPENAIDPNLFSSRRSGNAHTPLRAVFLGRLVPYKGADLLLHAAAPLIRQGKLVLELIGDGPQQAQLEQIIADEKLHQGVKLCGWIAHKDLQSHLAKADLFTFPSIREFGGGVVLEAMGVGLVPLVVNYAGPGELITPNTGFSVPIGTREDIVRQLRAKLEYIVENPKILQEMSDAAYERAHSHFTWRQKAEQIVRIYRWILDDDCSRQEKPYFPMPIPDGHIVSPPDGVLG